MKKILVTGFEPFGGNSINPSGIAAEFVGNKYENVYYEILPVTWKESYNVLEKAQNRLSPDVILMLGQAGGSESVRIERKCFNVCGAIKDNKGDYPERFIPGEKLPEIEQGGEPEYRTTIDCENILNAIMPTGIPAIFSYSAGNYLCNFVLYKTLNDVEKNERKTKVGFIHLPYITQQKKEDSFSLTTEELKIVMGAIIKAIG